MIPKYLEVFCIKKRISWSIIRGGGYPSKACSWVQGVKYWLSDRFRGFRSWQEAQKKLETQTLKFLAR